MSQAANPIANKWKRFFNTYVGIDFIIELFLFVLLFLFFKDVIDLFIEKTVIEYLFQYIHGGPETDVAWVLLCFIGALCPFTFGKWYQSKGRVTPKITLFFICVAVAYLIFYRTNQVWIVENIKQIDILRPFKYADFLVLFSSSNLIAWIYYIFKLSSQTTINQGFLEDQEIKTADDDLYGHDAYATSVADMILKTFPNKSITIGINAEWGSSKTSFIHLIEENLAGEKSIIPVWFNPWESRDSTFIIRDFFEILEAKSN